MVESTTRSTYNAIDPNHVIDADGRHWLSFGSFWSGLKLIELDPATGKPKVGAKVKGIAGRDPPGAIEAPFIFRRGDYYYLIAAYDFCCRGVDSSYYPASSGAGMERRWLAGGGLNSCQLSEEMAGLDMIKTATGWRYGRYF